MTKPAFLGEELQTVPTYRPQTRDYLVDGGTAITSGSVGALIGAAFSKKKNDKGAVLGALAGSAIGLGVVAPNLTVYRCGNNIYHLENNGRVPAHDANFVDFLIMAAGTAVSGWIGMAIGEHLGGRRKQSNGKAAAIGAITGAVLIGASANTTMLGVRCGPWKSAPGSGL